MRIINQKSLISHRTVLTFAFIDPICSFLKKKNNFDSDGDSHLLVYFQHSSRLSEVLVQVQLKLGIVKTDVCLGIRFTQPVLFALNKGGSNMCEGYWLFNLSGRGSRRIAFRQWPSFFPVVSNNVVTEYQILKLIQHRLMV